MLALATDRSHTPKGRRARDAIVAHAEGLLAARGFHGTSMRDIAAAARLPLATVVYHFARKEQLYAAVLGAIGDELVRDLAAIETTDALAAALVAWTMRNPQRVRLLLRELLDNPVRVSRAAHLPLAPFLERAAAISGSELSVLHAVGGLSYVIAAQPTVARIVGPERAKHLAAEREALAFVRRVFGEPHVARSAAAAPRSRPRTPRARDDRRRTRPVDAAGRRVRR